MPVRLKKNARNQESRAAVSIGTRDRCGHRRL